MRAFLSWMSCLLCWLATGRWEPICRAVARARGPDCTFCRLIAAMMKEPWHCRDQMTIEDVIQWLRRK